MFNPVPGQPFGMADIEVYGTIADHKNLVINQQIRNAEQLNRQIIGIMKEGVSGETDLEKIKTGQNSLVVFDGEEDIR